MPWTPELDVDALVAACASIAGPMWLRPPPRSRVEELLEKVISLGHVQSCREGVITFDELCDVFHLHIHTLVCEASPNANRSPWYTRYEDDYPPLSDTPRVLTEALRKALDS